MDSNGSEVSKIKYWDWDWKKYLSDVTTEYILNNICGIDENALWKIENQRNVVRFAAIGKIWGIRISNEVVIAINTGQEAPTVIGTEDDIEKLTNLVLDKVVEALKMREL